MEGHRGLHFVTLVANVKISNRELILLSYYCQKNSNGVPCKIYARYKKVVWKISGTGQNFAKKPAIRPSFHGLNNNQVCSQAIKYTFPKWDSARPYFVAEAKARQLTEASCAKLSGRFTDEIISGHVETQAKSDADRILRFGGSYSEVSKNVKELIVSRHCPGCDLQGANLSGAILKYANLDGANLSGAILSGANLEGASMWYAILGEARLSTVNLVGASLGRARLRGADLSSANLEGVNFNGADLNKVNLSKANLKWAQLNRSDFTGADLTGALISGRQQLVNAILCETKSSFGVLNDHCD